MIDFLVNNIGTISVSLLLIAILSAIVAVMVRNKKKGVSSCGGGCSGCPFSGRCHSGENGSEGGAEK